VTRDEVLDRLQVPLGTSLLSVNPADLERRLSAHPRIKTATVRRVLPHRLVVELREREPAAVLRTFSSAFLIDAEGAILSTVSEDADEALPVIIGINDTRVLANDTRWQRAVQDGIKLAGWLTEVLDGRPEIDLSDPAHAVVSIQDLRIQFGSMPLEEQWRRFRLVDPVGRSVPANGGMEIDLRFSNKVIVRERGQLS
jgi:hypothetical protein